MMLRFPEGFVWGAATSAYQIEGATNVDGRGESIWDRFSATSGTIEDGTDGSVACDHYHRWMDDIGLMRKIGLHAYRFSIAWPRVLPLGVKSSLNRRGLDFYDRLVDGLLDSGIDPVATLYHWDLPQALEDCGGWTERAVIDHFVDYVDIVTFRLGDRVKTWITHNEPWCISVLGYANGEHAPGIKSWPKALAASHHLLVSHGLAVEVIRHNAPEAEVGITLNLVPSVPASESEADREACRAFDGNFNRWYLDPLYGLGYPADVISDHRAAHHINSDNLPFVLDGDFEIIAKETDFLGVNYYSREVIRSQKIPNDKNSPISVFKSNDITDFGWEVYPTGLYDILMKVNEKYRPNKIYISENGAAYDTPPDTTGRIRDIKRETYLKNHFQAAHKALESGVPLAGYFVWSLLDNYEWAKGYTMRFGIIWVNYSTQERILKNSAYFYKNVIKNNEIQEAVS